MNNYRKERKGGGSRGRTEKLIHCLLRIISEGREELGVNFRLSTYANDCIRLLVNSFFSHLPYGFHI